MKLTIKQEKFATKYVECGNASEAYRFAYKCSRMKDKSIWEIASSLLKKVKVASRIQELKDELSKELNISKSEMIKLHYAVINSDILDYIDIVDKEMKNEDEQSFKYSLITFKDISSLPIEKRRLIQSIKIDRSGCPIVELMDKVKSAEIINKMLGFDAPTKIDADITTINKYKAVTSDGRIIEFDKIDGE